MAPCATFYNVPLSTSVNPVSERSLISFDWLLTAGILAPQSVAFGVLTLPSDNNGCVLGTHRLLTISVMHDDLENDFLNSVTQKWSTLPGIGIIKIRHNPSPVVTAGIRSGYSNLAEFEFPPRG
ncbi:hypothetical protein B0H14DRAFT_2565184 [Mycena olivaceomarginata]|nr:hypothetical protein B0H14DRAFT_2565184 [Mycena olivaceomarginata]